MGPVEKFKNERDERIRAYPANKAFFNAKEAFMRASIPAKYSYNFSWLDRPIIQYPQDIIVLQEIIWAVKPDLIIETGIAHGGSLVFSASMLALLEISGLINKGNVLGVDIDIREHNRVEIERHPLANRIKMIQGSSVDERVVKQVYDFANAHDNIFVILDSNHTHAHVLAELDAYARLVSKGSYCVVLDTMIEDMPAGTYEGRPWGPGNNPKTAVEQYLKTHKEFQADKDIENKLLITAAPGGYLKRLR